MNSIYKNKLWIVTELFYPDQTSTSYILSLIANAFVDKYDVGIITDSGFYQTNKSDSTSQFTINSKLKIMRVNSRNFDKNKINEVDEKIFQLIRSLK